MLVIKAVNQMKTWTATPKLIIHILPKNTRVNWWSKISIVFNETTGNVPWECPIYTLNTVSKLQGKKQQEVTFFWNKNKLMISFSHFFSLNFLRAFWSSNFLFSASGVGRASAIRYSKINIF